MQPNQPYPQYPIPPQRPGPPLRAHSARHSWGHIITVTLLILMLIGSVSFGAWAYTSRQEYKDKSDKLTARAVAIAVQQESTRKDSEFIEKEKNPLKIYKGSEAYGSVSISYPKTWAAYVVETDRTAAPIDGYFHPNFVPAAQKDLAYALRVQVTNLPYEQEMKQFEAKVKAGKVTVAPYTAKNVPSITGARVEGEIATGQKASMVLLPLRDKTIKIYTESQQFVGDFNNFVLTNLTFVP